MIKQKDQDPKIVTVEQLLSTLKEPSKEMSIEFDSRVKRESGLKRDSGVPLSNNNLFWTYNENEEDEKESKAP